MLLYKSIKNARVSLCTLGLVIILSIFSFRASAHFGSKGPFGGTLSCAIAKDSLVYIGTANGGVFESTTNALVAWRARPVGLTSGKITALTHSGSYLFAGTADSGVFIFNGFVGSDRYWIKINNGLSNLKIKSLLAIDSITVLAGTDGNGLYKTTDKGATWTAINSGLINNAVVTGLVKAGNRIILLSKTGGVFASDNNGSTWTDLNDVNTLNINGTNSFSYNSVNDVLLVSNANGLYTLNTASTATTPSYISAQTGLPANTLIRGISNNGTDWYVATDKGVYTTAASAVNWAAANTGLPGTDVRAVVALQNRLIAGVAQEGIYKATAGANTWAALNTGFNNPVTKTMTAAGDSLVVAVTDKGVFVSKNLATSYVKSNTGLTDSLHVNDVILAHDLLLAATQNGGVFSSEDSGATWASLNAGLSNLNIKWLFNATHHIFAIDADGHIFESVLHSGTWEAIQGGLPAGVQPTSMAFYGGTLFLGTLGHGVFTRDLHEGDWTAANNGLSNLNVTGVTASGNKIFAGTDGSGVFVSAIDTVSWSATAATSIAHTTMVGLNGNKIQAMGSYAGYVYASYKGGLLTTSDKGATWIAGGNQFNLPSFTDVRKVCFVSSRVFVPTENNAVYSNALSELPALPDTLIVSQDTLEVLATPGEESFISVTSNRSWTIAANQTWITLGASAGFRNGEFEVAVSPNPGSTKRTGLITVTAGDKVKTITVIQNGTTGIREATALQASLHLYPNPSDGLFTVDFSKVNALVKTIAVYDFTGRLVLEKAVNKNELSTTLTINQAAGIYFVKLDTNKGSISRKLIIR